MKRLAAYLKDTNTTQGQLAKAFGVSQPTVCDWVNGKKFPSTERLRKIAEHTGISVDELLGVRLRRRAAG